MKKMYGFIDELREYIQLEEIENIRSIENKKAKLIIGRIINMIAEAEKDHMGATEDIIAELRTKYGNADLFWTGIKSEVGKALVPYSEIMFLREMDVAEQKELIESVFDNLILHNEDINEFKIIDENIAEEEVKRLVKMLNTVTILIVERNVTKRYYLSEIHDLFRLDECIADMIWDMYHDSIEQLRYNQMFKYFKRQEDLMRLFLEKN